MKIITSKKYSYANFCFYSDLVRSIKESIFSFGFWVGANDIDQAKNFFWMEGTKSRFLNICISSLFYPKFIKV